MEQRIVKVVTVSAETTFPHARQAIQIIPKAPKIHQQESSTKVVYSITSLTTAQGTADEPTK